jgi:CDP-diacylglycerol--glycerol-3-phosphate 3-phosphatidyltransferase
MLLLGLLGWVTVWRGEGETVALKVLPLLALCLFLQQIDVFVHLGLNIAVDGRLRERLGMPTTLTLVRGTLAGMLVAHLLLGMYLLPALTFSAYLVGLATDMVDGRLARRTGWVTRLGGYLDGEADFYLSASVMLSAWLAGLLPGWFVAAVLLRFGVVTVVALFSYFVALRQVRFDHTVWGRLAGTGQALCLLFILFPGSPGLAFVPLALPLLAGTFILAGLASLMEIHRHLCVW